VRSKTGAHGIEEGPMTQTDEDTPSSCCPRVRLLLGTRNPSFATPVELGARHVPQLLTPYRAGSAFFESKNASFRAVLARHARVQDRSPFEGKAACVARGFCQQLCCPIHPYSSMIDKPVPELALPATGGRNVRFSELRGAPFVLYFYPKDNTPGCTLEGENFRDLYPQFTDLGWNVFGVSRDSIRSHESFKAKMSFPFELLSDAEEKS
jgi:hypothetical protein